MSHIERTKKSQLGHRMVGGPTCIDGKTALCYYACFEIVCEMDTPEALAAMEWNRKCWEDVDGRIADMEANAKTEVERLRAENERLKAEAK